jgi:hypothetical protein
MGLPAARTLPVSSLVELDEDVSSAARLVDQPEMNTKVAATASAVRLGLRRADRVTLRRPLESNEVDFGAVSLIDPFANGPIQPARALVVVGQSEKTRVFLLVFMDFHFA